MQEISEVKAQKIKARDPLLWTESKRSMIETETNLLFAFFFFHPSLAQKAGLFEYINLLKF